MKNKNLIDGMNLDELSLRDICEEITDIKKDISNADTDERVIYLQGVLKVLQNYKKRLLEEEEEQEEEQEEAQLNNIENDRYYFNFVEGLSKKYKTNKRYY